jgi:3-vinyl bacteriochlorophyllide hydratase
MYLALAGYGAYAINATQFLMKLRAARRQEREERAARAAAGPAGGAAVPDGSITG